MSAQIKHNMRDDQEFNLWFVKEIEKYPSLYNHGDPMYINKRKQEELWQAIAKKSGTSVLECKDRWKNLRACFTRHLKHVALELKTGIKYRRPYYLAEAMNFILPFTKSRSHSKEDMKYYNDFLKGTSSSDDNVIFIDADNDDDDNDSRYECENDDISYNETQYESYEPLAPKEAAENTSNSESNVSREIVHNDCEIIPLKRQRLKTISEADMETYFQKSNVDTKFDTAQFKGELQDEDEDSDLSFFKSLLPDTKCMNNRQKRKFKIGVLKLLDEILDPLNVS